MENLSSIITKLYDFESFVGHLSYKMRLAVEETNLLVDLRTDKDDFVMPVTLDDYLKLWNYVTDRLQTEDCVDIFFFENDNNTHTAYELETTMRISWDKEHGKYVLE